MPQKRLNREEAILLSLKKLDYLSRKQLQKLHDLRGDRNALRVLDSMSEFLSSFRSDTGENIYYLNKAGRDRVGCEVVRQKSSQVNHFLMRNDAYIHYRAEDWKNEMIIKAKNQKGEVTVTLTPDAYYRYNLRRHFLEVDHLQNMQKNREKIERYKKFKVTNIFQNDLKYFPPLVWVTMTESRKKQLLEWCDGLETVVHVWDEIK